MSKKKANFFNLIAGINIPTYITGSVNTYIGGVGGNKVTSPADLAAKTSLLESNITNFQIDDNLNVACFVDTNYTINAGTFGGANFETTHYIDLDNHVTNINANAFIQAYGLKIFYGKNGSVDGGLNSRQFRQCTAMKVWYDMTTHMGYTNALQQQIFLGTGNCDIFANVFLETCSVNIYARAIVKPVGVLAGDTVTIDGLVYTAVTGIKADNTEFSVDTSNQACADDLADSITNDVRVGTLGDIIVASTTLAQVTIDTTVLGFAGNSVELTSSNGTRLQLTAFSGGYDAGTLEPDLNVAQDAGSTLIFVDPSTDLDTPSAPTGLFATNVTANSFDITFTPPSTLYTIYKYEVWLNGGWFKQWINISGDTVTGLSSKTAYKIKLVTTDIYYNRSGFSNEITIITA